MSNEKYGISTEARLSERTTYIDEKTGSPTDIDHDNQKFHDVVLAEADTTHEVGLDLYLHADEVEYTEAEAKKVSVFQLLWLAILLSLIKLQFAEDRSPDPPSLLHDTGSLNP